MPAIPHELVLPTFSARCLDDGLIVFVCKPGHEIADADWQVYVDWLKALQVQTPDLGVLTAAGGRPPSSAQGSLINRELKTDRIRLAVLLSDWKLVAVVRVSSWFMKGAEPFHAHELDKALAYLGGTDSSRVRTTIRELGGTVFKTAL